MRITAKIFLLLPLMLVLSLQYAIPQATSSPYSAFGLGYPEENSLGPSKGMGGTGIAFLSRSSINLLNPASYSGIDSLVSIFELGVFGKYTSFKSNNDQQSQANANLKYIVMGFRVTPWLTTSFGFAPYSSIGYNISTTAPVEGSGITYTKTFSGNGGVNQAYIGGAVRLIKNLSLGFNAAYLFGDVTHSESSDYFSFSLKDVTYLSNFNFNYGLNYQFGIKKWTYNVGLIYSGAKSLGTKNVTTIETLGATEVLNSRIYRYSIPQNYGIGILVSKEFFRVGADYERSSWKDVDISNPLVRTRDGNRYSVGVEFPSQGLKKGTSRMILYRFGGEYRQSYLIVDNVPLNYKAITLGAGFPLKGWLSTINVAVELGQNGTTRNGLFRENFCTLHLDVSLRDTWFRRRRYE
ncbi:MAG: hypothetical protein WCE64_03925 [Bacteroidales bacterium]